MSTQLKHTDDREVPALEMPSLAEDALAYRAVPAPVISADDLVDGPWLDAMLARVDKSGLRLTGEGGFLPALIKAVLERGLQVELTDHLGYEKGDPAGRGAPNSRNGTTPKTLSTEAGEVDLAAPRDRDSSFEPRLVPKGARRLAGGLDEMIISLYAGGMTVRDIGYHLERTLGVELSHETISKITDAITEEVKAWQTRPLDRQGLPDRLHRRAGGQGPRQRACDQQGRTHRGRRGHRRDQARARDLGAVRRGLMAFIEIPQCCSAKFLTLGSCQGSGQLGFMGCLRSSSWRRGVAGSARLRGVVGSLGSGRRRCSSAVGAGCARSWG
jgi:hypothetical protein